MHSRTRTPDRTLLVIVALLTVVGMLIFFSAALSLLPRGGTAFGMALVTQLVLGFVGGVLALVGVMHVPLVLIKRYAPHVFVGAAVLTAAVFLPVLGVSANGATRWLDLGITTFQPAELLKIGYVVLLAKILSSGRELGKDLRLGIVPFAVLSLVVSVLLLIQPDTDTLVIMLMSGVAMMFVTGFRVRDIGILAVIGLLGLGALLYMRPYLLDRIQTFVDPSRDLQGSGYQIHQSLIAVGSGEVWGRGFGQSVQKFTYLPEASSDSIFAVYAEEFGFVGSLFLLALFVCFVLRGLWVAARAEDIFGALIAVGIVVLIGAQAFLNIAAMTGLVPVGGLPLPFVSRGGSALFMTLVMAGLLLSVSRTVRV